MSKDIPSIAKNKIKRSLRAIIDPLPSKKEISSLWEYFENSCAYCNVKIDPDSRLGHLDHVIAQSDRGNNSIYNHVLSCAKCNGDEKREMDWKIFLKQKLVNSEKFNIQKLKIENWLEKNNIVKIELKRKEKVDKIIADALAQFDISVQSMRALKNDIYQD
jgi:5-methylcytosine-specific restriction endonuclease McrA